MNALRRHQLLPSLVTASALLLLNACGIDQGGLQDPPEPPRTALVVGPITGFGSVLVNGLELDTTSAEILIDGSPGTEAELRQGQLIRAVAQSNGSGDRAVSIEFRKNISGPVDAIDLAGDGLTVLQYPVRIDASTYWDIPQVNGLADLVIGRHVLVSGFLTHTAEILATYVGEAPAGAALEITAPITATDNSRLTFRIGPVSVDYSTAVLLELPGGMPETGAIVEVIGTTLIDGVLQANEVRAVARLPGVFNAAITELSASEIGLVSAPAADTELSANLVGIVTGTDLPEQISLAEVDVLLGSGATIVGNRDDLTPGARLQIEGRVLETGLIQAERVTIL